MYKKRKKYNIKKIYIIIALVIFFIVGFVVNVLCKDRNLTIFEKAIKDSVLAVEKVLSYPIDFISNKIVEYNEKNKISNFDTSCVDDALCSCSSRHRLRLGR